MRFSAVNISDNHTGSCPDKAFSNRPPNPARSTGDDGHLAGQVKHVGD
jgi:hypothetical protein